MSVRATTRREQIRRPNGDRVILPGGQDATGLSALAAVSAGVDTLTGAARHATQADVIEPAAEAVVLFENLEGTTAYLSNDTLPAGVTMPYGYINLNLPDRNDNAGWSVARCDSGDRCDDPQTQAGTAASAGQAALDATNAPQIYSFATPLDRALVNGQADPALTAWLLASAPSRVNMFPTPTHVVAGVPAIWGTTFAGTVSDVAAAGYAGTRYLRLTATGSGAFSIASREFGVVAPGQSVTVQIRLKGTTPQGTVRLETFSGGATSTTLTLSGAWQLKTVTYTHPTTAATQRLKVVVTGLGATAGQVLDFDATFVETGAVAGTYVDPAFGAVGGSTITYARTANASPTLIAPTVTGAYTRPVDATAPQLGLPGSKWVHRRTGTLVAGARISTPWTQCAYAFLPGRTFTVAAWISTTPTTGTLPSFRWVLELAADPGTSVGQAFIVATSQPFSPADAYARFTAFLEPAIPFGIQHTALVRSLRVHLECVDPGSIGAGATVSIRGAHLYAGADRGDTSGLNAVIMPAPITWVVSLLSPTDPSFKATRVDVHGNDQISHVTAVSGQLVDKASIGHDLVGASAGRLTLRVPDPDTTGLFWYARLNAEEVNGGPGSQASLQTIRVWHEEDATPDIVALTVDRASDADPSSSTVPIGNYAASTIDVELDDAEGTWSLFGRQYIDLGHRIEAAVGVTYTNRCDDPLGIDAAAAAASSLTWPTAAVGTSPVVPAGRDAYGQVPPAPYVGHALAAVAPMCATTGAGEGWSMRGSVWVRYTGVTVPTLTVCPVRRYAVPGAGVTVVNVGAPVALPFTAAPNVWTLVKVPTTVIPLGANALAVYAGVGVADASRFLELGAPDFERVDPTTGDVIEVVETAPAGVFSSTSWDAATGGASVQVSGIDVLATAGSADLGTDLRVGTTVEAELRFIAREYLDLGADQVVIVDQGTPLPYAIPAQKVSTQIADLAKVAALTAFTDGAGRFTALLRSEVDPDLAATYLSDRNLVTASAGIAPDAVRNDVKVTAHPISRTAGATLATVGNSTATDTAAAGWELSGQEVYLPPGNGAVVIEVAWQLDAALSGVIVNPVGWFDWQVGQAAPFNAFYVEPDGTTTIPFPPGSNWGVTLGGFQSWATASVEVYPTFGRITLTNRQADPGPGAFVPAIYAPAVWVDHLEIIGDGLTVTSVSQRFVRDDSVEAFGSQPVDVDVRLAQSSALLSIVGTDVLDNYSLRDASGERWLPDLEVSLLADPWRELGDRVLIGDADSAIGGEYRVLTHALTVAVGAESKMYLRRVPVGVLFAVTDVSLADDGKVTTY